MFSGKLKDLARKGHTAMVPRTAPHQDKDIRPCLQHVEQTLALCKAERSKARAPERGSG